MRNWLARLMYGRNGADNFCRFLAVCAFVFVIAAMFIPVQPVKSIIYYIGLALIIYCLFREFSKNLYKRQQENRFYLDKKWKLQRKWRGFKTRIRQKRDYRFYSCPTCRVTTRVPKGKGRIIITCPKCGAQFERKS